MKTNIQLQSWLRRAAVLLITLAGCLPIAAQEEEIEGGEAFYIYQNDGRFDGFFYDQVKQIRYSRLDMLGIEHDRYVSQEIVTEDSVYRIMLTAIDSVSYVQPEIKFAKEVRFMRDEGMMAYYLSISKPNEDSFLLRFSDSMPVALQPKVGDVLSCPKLPDYEEAFVGKVKKVRQEGGETVVECSYIDDLKDVFEQFITVEQVRNIQTAEGSKTRCRIAGLPTRAEGNFSDILLFEYNKSGELVINFTDSLKFRTKLDVGFGVMMTGVYNISWSDFYIKLEAKEQIGIGLTVALDGVLRNSIDPSTMPGIDKFVGVFSKIPIPASFPILYANLTPLPFTRAEAHFKAELNTGLTAKALRQSIEISKNWPYFNIEFNVLPQLFLPLPNDPIGSFNLDAQINGMVQTGVKFPIEVGMQDWIKKLIHLYSGTTIYAGPKISGTLDFDLLKYPFGAYEALKKTKVELTLMSFDTELSCKSEIFGKGVEFNDNKNVSYGKYTFSLFPAIEGMKCTLEGEEQNITHCVYKVSGDVCCPQYLGVGLYIKENEDDIYYSKLFMKKMRDEIYFMNTFNYVDVEFTDVPEGEYRVRPLIQAMVDVPVMAEEQTLIISPKELLLNPSEIMAEEEGGSFTVKLVSQYDFPITPSTEDKWITTEIVKPSGNQKYYSMIVNVAENNTDAYRTGSVKVRQQYSDTDYDEKTLTVKQYGGLELSKSKLEFTKEGGELTIDILTSYKPITIALGDDYTWLTYYLDDRKLTIKADPNQDGNRTATIIISAFSKKKNRNVEVKLTITQKGLVDASIEPTELNFDVDGGTLPVYVAVGNDTEFTGVSVRDKSDTWVTVEKKTSIFNVTVKPNEDEKRTAYVDATFTAKDKDGKTYTVTLPVTITQKGIVQASVMPSELLFDAKSDDREAAITKGDYSYCGAWVEDSAKDWLSVTVEDKGEYATLIATATENKSDDGRSGEITVYFSTVPNPQEMDMTKVTIKVTQKGKGKSIRTLLEGLPEAYYPRFVNVYFEGPCSYSWRRNDENEQGIRNYSQWLTGELQKKAKLNVSFSGSQATVTAVYQNESENSGTIYSANMIIDNIDSDEGLITSLDFYFKRDYKFVRDNYYNEGFYERVLKASNIPINCRDISYESNDGTVLYQFSEITHDYLRKKDANGKVSVETTDSEYKWVSDPDFILRVCFDPGTILIDPNNPWDD